MPPWTLSRLWIRVCSKDWWGKVVLKEFSDGELRENRSFTRFCSMMEMSMHPQDVTVHTTVQLEMCVPVALYRLGSCGEYSIIANQFGKHICMLKYFVDLFFCKGVVSVVTHDLFKVPTLKEACVITHRFDIVCHVL